MIVAESEAIRPPKNLLRRRSGGYCLRLFVAVVLVWAAGLPSAAQDSSAPPLSCPFAGHSDGVDRGVNRTNLGWTRDWKPILDQIVDHQIKSIRLTLTEPVERAAEIAAYADSRGMRVLVNVGLSVGYYYDPAIRPRPGRGIVREVRGLSDLDVDRYRETLTKFLALLDQRKARLYALEIGNEINWADFNGDFPVAEQGRIFDEQSLGRASEGNRILAGFRKYRTTLDIARTALRASAAGRGALLVAAGLYEPSPWTIKSNGSALSLPATKSIFDQLGITGAVDALAVHVYPSRDVIGEAMADRVFASARATTQICGTRADGKPCLITEWGFPNDIAPQAERLRIFRAFETALACLDRERDLRGAYLFTWDESPRQAVWQNGKLIGGGEIFADPPIE